MKAAAAAAAAAAVKMELFRTGLEWLNL